MSIEYKMSLRTTDSIKRELQKETISETTYYHVYVLKFQYKIASFRNRFPKLFRHPYFGI